MNVPSRTSAPHWPVDNKFVFNSSNHSGKVSSSFLLLPSWPLLVLPLTLPLLYAEDRRTAEEEEEEEEEGMVVVGSGRWGEFVEEVVAGRERDGGTVEDTAAVVVGDVMSDIFVEKERRERREEKRGEERRGKSLVRCCSFCSQCPVTKSKRLTTWFDKNRIIKFFSLITGYGWFSW